MYAYLRLPSARKGTCKSNICMQTVPAFVLLCCVSLCLCLVRFFFYQHHLPSTPSQNSIIFLKFLTNTTLEWYPATPARNFFQWTILVQQPTLVPHDIQTVHIWGLKLCKSFTLISQTLKELSPSMAAIQIFPRHMIYIRLLHRSMYQCLWIIQRG